MSAFYAYILASRPYGTLYIGVTNSILSRVASHRAGTASKFTRKYKATKLVYFEIFDDPEIAIQREKTLKHHVRAWKINLIERDNSGWLDLYPELLALPENASVRGALEMGPRDKREDDHRG